LLKEIKREEIEKIIRELKNNKTRGPDNIINEQIKYGPQILWDILRKIMNNVIRIGKIPKKWKEMNIFTIRPK
jgi:hypothetical protein